MDALLVGSGDIKSISLLQQVACLSQLLICVDGGARHLEKANITPGVLLGDLDSIDENTLAVYEKRQVEIVKFPAQKDYTDMELALDYAVEHGATRIFIMGATGTRTDHTLSNLQLLHKLLDIGVRGVIVNDNNRVYLIKDKITIARIEGYKLSLIPATPTVEGITTEGLAYPLSGFTMKMGTSLGISNEFISSKASVSITGGRLYVILSKD